MQIDDKAKQNSDGHPSESTPTSTMALPEMGKDVTDASAPNQASPENNTGVNLPPGSRTEGHLVEADGTSQPEQGAEMANLQPSTKSSSIAFSSTNIGAGIKFVSSVSGATLREQLNGSVSEEQDNERPGNGLESCRLAQEQDTQLSQDGVEPPSAPCDKAHQAESKEMAKENEDPGTDSLLDTSQEKSFSEEPATDSSCSATLPPGQSHTDREKQRTSGKRRKKRHSKSYSGRLHGTWGLS